MRKQGDVSRKRRLVGSAAKIAWYALYRSTRFSTSDFTKSRKPKVITETLKLFEETKKLDPNKRWYKPFPMGVFGTLRQGHWNNGLMHVGDVKNHVKAFMPHFSASGLSINFEKDASAPFEIFYYLPDQWKRMIPRVDSLEGFHPEYIELNEEGQPKSEKWGYYRTLAWLHILPEDYKHDLFTNSYLGRDRNLKISPDEWNKYERIPCWVYSNLHSNAASREAKTDVVIWG